LAPGLVPTVMLTGQGAYDRAQQQGIAFWRPSVPRQDSGVRLRRHL